MKRAKKVTEHFLLPLNLAFLSFLGVFLVYEWDKWTMAETQLAAPSALLSSAIAFVFLAMAIKLRSPYFHAFCSLLGIIALVILI